MEGYFGKIGSSFLSMWHSREGINLKSIRLSRMCYMLAYTFELILFLVRGHFMPVGADVCGVSGGTIIVAVHGITSVVVMLLWSKRFKPLVWASVSVMVLGFVPYILLPESDLRLVFAIVAYAGLGGAVTSARCGFAFAVNNAERLVGMVIMFFSCAVVRYIDADTANPVFWAQVLPMLLVIALSICLIMFREKDLEVRESSDKADAGAMYWALAYFMMYFTVDGYMWGILDSDNRAEYKFLLAGLFIAGAVLVLMMTVLKLNVWHVWNFFFAVTVAMALFTVFADRIGSRKPQYFFSGLADIGWPLSIYMLACVQRRFASYKLLKKCTLIFAIASPILYFSDEFFEDFYPELSPIAMLVTVMVFTVLALMLSPISYKQLFSLKWITQLNANDMELIREKVDERDKFGEYALTPRQKEIATLLLAAKTRRQIAGELGVSESTVKNHTSELYKKLGINSRVELFKIFGVDENADE